jgi:monooxygenase
MSPVDVDVVIVGAGLSGVGAAAHLTRECPGKSYVVLESREAIGGTWDLFRYPGIRSDSDMYTLGYSFKPWRRHNSIADGAEILDYIRETAAEYGVDRRIRFGHRVTEVAWSSEDSTWTVTSDRRSANGVSEQVHTRCRFLFLCCGYYDYERPFAPEFDGAEEFEGQIVHPQFWAEDTDYRDKRVVVIGSGATAVTLIPSLAGHARHVTMLQRSPSYVVSLPASDPFAGFVNRLLPPRFAYSVIRWKNVLVSMAFFNLSRRRPRLIRKFIREGVARNLPDGYDVDTHFNPDYDPWDQRVCLVPDADLFAALRNGSASIVTDRIERFDRAGIVLASGERLDADLIVTATGLNLIPFGNTRFVVDGRERPISEQFAYRGSMLSGIPNTIFAAGYTNASWTLKCDLTLEYACRLINHMDVHSYAAAVPLAVPGLGTAPFLDLTAGYVQRAVERFPKQGDRAPWRLDQNYIRDIRTLRRAELEDGVLHFAREGEPLGEAELADPAPPVAA